MTSNQIVELLIGIHGKLPTQDVLNHGIAVNRALQSEEIALVAVRHYLCGTGWMCESLATTLAESIVNLDRAIVSVNL